MKLIVKQKGRRGIRLWFPTRLIFSRTAFKIFRRSLAKSQKMPETPAHALEDAEEDLDYRQLLMEEETAAQTAGTEPADTMVEGVGEREETGKGFDFGTFMAELPDEQVDQVLGLFRRMKKDHPGVPLVEVQSADGDRVLIQL